MAIKVFIGSHKRFARCEPVIEYSIRKYASEPVDIQFLRPDRYGCPETGCTGFSRMRWEIPRICNHKGYAIYLDVDMILMTDIKELWDMRQEGKCLTMMDGSTEVMVMDCNYASKLAYIPHEWNVEDYRATREDIAEAKIIHYTDLKTQPWFYEHPKPWLSGIWFDMEREIEKTN